MERLSQPLPYSLRVRESFQLSHFNSMTKVHSREGTFLRYDLYSFTLYEQHVVPRRVIPSCIWYCDVLEAIFSIDDGHAIGGLCGRPHASWCAPLAPHVTFMIISCRMIVAANKWLKGHLLLFFLKQEGDTL